jgi:hypothetical protein
MMRLARVGAALAALFCAMALTSTADAAVYKVPNANSHHYPPRQIAITMTVPPGMTYKNPVYYRVGRLREETGDWFKGGGYANTLIGDQKVGQAVPAQGDGFSWQKSRPDDPACSGGPQWTGRESNVGDVQICEDYCFNIVTTCLIPAPSSADGTPGNQLETLWKPTTGGGWLVMWLDLIIRTPVTYDWNFSGPVFSEALAIMQSANRVG